MMVAPPRRRHVLVVVTVFVFGSALLYVRLASEFWSQQALLVDVVEPTDTRPRCNASNVADGEWTPVMLEQAPYFVHTQHLRCFNDSKYYKQKPFPSYQWTPRTCRLDPWNPARFIQQTVNQTVSIVGDSLSWEHYRSLLQLLREEVHQADQHRSKILNQNVVHLTSRTLAFNGTNYWWKFVWRNDQYLHHVADSIEKDPPDILVLNRGAHYVNDTLLRSDMINLTHATLLPHLSQCPHCRVFWRTTVPGHPHCYRFDKPATNMDDMRALIHNRSWYEARNASHYYWWDFERQNTWVVQYLAQALPPHQFTVIPAYEVNILRPDEHRAHQGDCLHSCYPGKMDVYSQILMHFLSDD